MYSCHSRFEGPDVITVTDGWSEVGQIRASEGHPQAKVSPFFLEDLSALLRAPEVKKLSKILVTSAGGGKK